jgi:hypothetical protein
MKSHVAIYKTHDEAISAIKLLSDKNFPMEHVSLIGKADIIDDHIEVKSLEKIKLAPLFVCLTSGIVLGILSGLQIIKIPRLDFMHDAGIITSAFLGFNFGLITGGFSTIIISILVSKDKVLKYKEHLVGKKFLVIVNGALNEIERAEHILHTEGIHLSVA